MRIRPPSAEHYQRMTSTLARKLHKTRPQAGEKTHVQGASSARLARRFIFTLIWLVVWHLASVSIGTSLLLPGPIEVARRLVELVVTQAFWTVVLFSLTRICAGFLLAFVLGLTLGLLAGHLRVVRDFLEPAILALKSVPIVCVVVLLLIWVGAREVSVVAVFLAVFPPIYLSVCEAIRAQDTRLNALLKAMDVSAWRRFLASTYQQLLPYLRATSRNACGIAWKAGVAAELIGSPRGSMGERIYQAKLILETPDLFAWTIAVVSMSWLCEKIFLALLNQTGPLTLKLAVPRPHAAQTAPSAGALSLGHVTLGHAGGAIIARDLNWHFDAGQRYALTDPSGAGKTTLVETLSGMLAPLAGELTITPVTPLSVVTQDIRLVEQMSAEENVLLSAEGSMDFAQVHELLLQVLPPDALGRPVAGLSGGQRRRVEIVRALAHPHGILLMDEPLSALDEKSRQKTAHFIVEMLGTNTLIVASHNPEDLTLLQIDHTISLK
jgi:NitT/TauT family transport system permease protein